MRCPHSAIHSFAVCSNRLIDRWSSPLERDRDDPVLFLRSNEFILLAMPFLMILRMIRVLFMVFVTLELFYILRWPCLSIVQRTSSSTFPHPWRLTSR